MQKFCPQCQGIFEAQFLCPNCGITLRDGRDGPAPAPSAADAGHLPSVSIAQRLLAGLLISQSGALAIMQATGALESLCGLPNIFAADSARFALHASTLLLGAAIAGAANPGFLLTGVTIGLINSFFLIGMQFMVGIRSSPLSLILITGVSTGLGLLGSFIGSRYWPALSLFTPTIQSTPKAKKKEPKVTAPPVPIAWFRVLGGAALSIGCTVWAGPIRDFIVQNSRGAFSVDSRFQLQFTAWIISALAMLIGGALAGASTRGGIRHGFLVGLFASIGVFIIHLKVVKEVLPAQRFFSIVVGLPDDNTPSLGLTGLFLLTNTLLIGTLGGWFGAKLLPRVLPPSSPLDRGAI